MLIGELLYNLFLITLLIVISGFIDTRINREKIPGKILQGVLFGLTVVIGMIFPFVIEKGLIFDGRSIVISLGTLFFGPVTGFIATLMAAAYRIYIGGHGIVMGLLVILASFFLGWTFHYFIKIKKRFEITIIRLYIFGLLVHIVMFLLILTLPTPLVALTFKTLSLMILGVYPIISLVAGKILLDQEFLQSSIENLKKSENLFRTTLYSLADAVITTDSGGKIRNMNLTAENLTGWKESEAIGKPSRNIFQAFDESTGEQIPDPVEKVLLEGRPIDPSNNLMLISKDAKKLPIAHNGSPIRNDKGKIVGAVLVLRDQSGERASRKLLTESESKFRKIFEQSQSGIVITKLNEPGIVEINNSMIELLGFSKEDINGNIGLDNYVENFNLLRQTFIEELRKSGSLRNRITVVWTKDRKPIKVFLSADILLLNNVEHILLIFSDITELIRLQEELKAKEANYRLLVENQTDLVVKIDTDGKFLFVSPTYCKMFGKDEVELLGNTFYPLIQEDEKSLNEKGLKNLQLPPHSIYIEQRALTVNGWKWLGWQNTAVFDEKGNIEAFVGVGRDITEKKKAEQFKQVQFNIAKAVVNSKNLEELLITVHNELSSVIDIKNFYYAFYDQVTGIFTSLIDTDEKDDISSWKAEGSLTGMIIDQKKSLLLKKNEIETLVSDKKLNLIGTIPEVWLGVPLILGSRIIGAIVVQNYEDQSTFNENSKEILEIIAHELSIYIEHKKAELKALQLSKATEQSPVSILITDLRGNIEYVNPKFLDLTGYSLEEVIGQNPKILKSGEQQQDFYKKMWQIITSGKDWSGHLHNKKKNGDLFWESAIISPIKNESGEITHYLAVKEDITEKKAMLEQIFSSESQFRAIWENSVDGMRLLDGNGTIIDVNKAFCELVDRPAHKLVGKPYISIYPLQDKYLTDLSSYKDRFATRTIKELFDAKIKLWNGKELWVELSNSYLDIPGKNRMLLSIFRNITDKKKLIDELIEARDRAEEMNRIKSYFFAHMSHELRTPFWGITGYAELLLESIKDPEDRELALGILDSSKRLTKTLTDILEVTKLEFEKTEVNLTEVDIIEAIKAVCEEFSASVQQKNLILNNNFAVSKFIFQTDPHLLGGVLSNLISNAIKFTNAGSISVDAKIISDEFLNYLEISVKDTGIGIKAEKQDIIWEQFRQASEGTTRSFQGSGLGLAIVKKYVLLLGGQITLQSVEGKGSEFIIRFPVN